MLEFISFKKLVEDAKLRNKIFNGKLRLNSVINGSMS